jgi:hypothetical protein
MRTRSKLLFAVLTATALMSIAVSSASARRFQISNQRFLAIWTLLSFEVEGFSTISCPVTLEGSFHSASLSKVSGQLIGYVTSAQVRGGEAECNNTGTATVLSETLPWHVRYDRFIGALPNITEIRIQLIGARFRVGSGTICLAGTTASSPGFGSVIRDTVTGNANRLRADENARIPLHEGFTCEFLAPESNFRGTAEVFLQGSTSTRIVIRLVQ